jgi:hypothetical protein
MSLTQATQNIAKAIYYERFPTGEWGFLTPTEKSEYYDQAQAAEQAFHASKPPSVRRQGVPINRSIAKQRVTMRLRLDWLRSAAENAQKYSYSDPSLDEATRVLGKAGPLLAELLDGDDDVHGPSDFGKEFVRRYAALGRLGGGRRSR